MTRRNVLIGVLVLIIIVVLLWWKGCVVFPSLPGSNNSNKADSLKSAKDTSEVAKLRSEMDEFKKNCRCGPKVPQAPRAPRQQPSQPAAPPQQPVQQQPAQPAFQQPVTQQPVTQQPAQPATRKYYTPVFSGDHGITVDNGCLVYYVTDAALKAGQNQPTASKPRLNTMIDGKEFSWENGLWVLRTTTPYKDNMIVKWCVGIGWHSEDNYDMYIPHEWNKLGTLNSDMHKHAKDIGWEWWTSPQFK